MIVAACAVMLLLFTGLRRDDASKLGQQHVRDGVICFRTGKTKEVLVTLLATPLAEAIKASKQGSGDMAFLKNNHGNKFASGNAFGNWFKDPCKEAGIPHCTAHGLRKAAASLAAGEGASDMILEAMFTWTVTGDNNQSRTYTRGAANERLANKGFAMVEDALVRAGILGAEHNNNKIVSVF